MEMVEPTAPPQAQWHEFLQAYTENLPKITPVRAQMKTALKAAETPVGVVALVAGEAVDSPTKAFQKAEGLPETGVLDAATRDLAALRYNFGTRRFRIGPDRRGVAGKGDLREQRPYFLVPLDEEADEWENIQGRIVNHVRAASQQDTVAILRRRDIHDWKFLTDALSDAAVALAEPAPAATVPDAKKEEKPLSDMERMAHHLCSLFTPDTLASLRVLHGAGRTVAANGMGLWPRQLRDTLLAEINDALTSGRLDVAHDDLSVTLAPEPEGVERLRANRQALEDAFPESVIRPVS